MREKWQPVMGWDGLYEVSDRGRVRSVTRVVNGGRGPRTVVGRVLRQGNVYGYKTVSLSRPGRAAVPARVHRLVLLSFCGAGPSADSHCCHGNGDRADNRLSNLRWASAKENDGDKDQHGTRQRLEKHPRAKLNSRAVLDLRAGALSAREAARIYGCSISTAYDAKYGRSWTLKEYAR